MATTLTTHRVTEIDEIVDLADDYAAEFIGSLPTSGSGDDLRIALSGTLLSFLSDVIRKAL